jgi:prepilin-type N-terminal cleavage/methylation domain-containing protein
MKGLKVLLPMRKDNGFTLFELLTVIAVIGIVSAISIPNLFSFAAGMRLRSASRDLYSNFQQTRIKAIRQNTRWAVRFTASGYQVEDCKNNNCSVAADNRIIKTVNMSQAYPGVSITNTTNALVEFNSEGTTFNVAGTSTAGTTTMANTKGNSNVVVDLTGRIRMTP